MAEDNTILNQQAFVKIMLSVEVSTLRSAYPAEAQQIQEMVASNATG